MMLLLALWSSPLSAASPGGAPHAHDPAGEGPEVGEPEVYPTRRERPALWAAERGWRVSAAAGPEVGPDGLVGRTGARVAAIVTASGPVAVEARGVGDGVGPWVPARETFSQDGRRVMVADVGEWPRAQVRVRGEADEVAWKLTRPRFPASPPTGTDAAPPPRSALLPELAAIGVVSRDAWGARTTTCSSTEDDWYRMAIHHTAGQQTYNGTVLQEVQLLQAYAMDSGEYCDVPYQFLVGYDGSMWEGRPQNYYSGATYNNNDGNIAVVFIGCYHPNSCPNGAGDEVTDAMMVWGGYLTSTLTAYWGIPRDSDSIRGHRDWPDNATACPGDWLWDRLEELRNPVAPYAAAYAGQSFPTADQALTIPLGTEVAGYIDLVNTGTATWTPGNTNLAPMPRDAASPYQGSDWVSSTRAATVQATTQPGGTGRFAFSLRGNSVGDGLVYFGLVQEWVTWFADAPYGGGPSEDLLAVHVVVTESSGETGGGTGDDTGGGDNGGSGGGNGGYGGGAETGAMLPGEAVESRSIEGCACGSAGGGLRGAAIALGALATVGLARRRDSRGDAAPHPPRRRR